VSQTSMTEPTDSLAGKSCYKLSRDCDEFAGEFGEVKVKAHFAKSQEAKEENHISK